METTFKHKTNCDTNEYMFYYRETGILDMHPHYIKLCQVFGTPTDVAIIREMSDIREILKKQTLRKVYQEMESGSRREGFRLKGSDMDTMVWPDNHRVIWNKSMSKRYTDDCILLLGDTNESPPGFTLLEVLTKTDKTFEIPKTDLNCKIYIPSLKFKRDAHLIDLPKSVVHGPCDRFVQAGVETDVVTCFACDFWPQSASSWIKRDSLHWPKQEIIDDVVRNGCHVVPIGNPLSPYRDTEWRISFSLAEYKIVKSMNHPQFLAYGLLKILLKEVINRQSDESKILLCSYYMKTAIFWTIQQNPKFKWCPHNLFDGFWMCFKLLLKWVYEGVCPNFFIPQNNMFRSKIYGSAQENLFLQLHSLYKEGHESLLKRTSINEVFNTLALEEMSIHGENVFFRELNLHDTYVFMEDIHHCKEILHAIENLIGTPMTENQTAVLQKHAATIIQWTAFMLHNTIKSNKSCNMFDIPCHMLEVAAKLGPVSDNVYIAIYYYRTNRYAEALSVIRKMKKMLRDTKQCETGNYCHYYAERCTTDLGEHVWLFKMVQDVKFSNDICFIEELQWEQLCAIENNQWMLAIPLFVTIQFVEFLCSRHIGTVAATDALERLQTLIQRDQETYVPVIYRDISWHILGICQQINGDFPAARYSYEQSLKQYQWNKIQNETRVRINEIAIAKNSSRSLVKKDIH